MKKLLFTLLLFVCALNIKAQQLPHTSGLQDMQHVWNPAFTAPGTYMDFTGFYRKQWIGVDNSPNTALASVQYPFLKMNMSAGGSIISDRSGPISKLGLQLSYAYKLKELLNDGDQLSLGVNGFFYQYRFDPSKEIISQPDDEVIINMMTQSKFSPSIGFGFAYFTNIDDYGSDNDF